MAWARKRWLLPHPPTTRATIRWALSKQRRFALCAFARRRPEPGDRWPPVADLKFMASQQFWTLRPCIGAAALIAAALVTGTALAEPTGAPVANFTLANGLELVVIPDRRAPVVTHMIWYKVGAADETPGKSGLAHFLEHLMFKGTAKHPTGHFSQVVATIGGQENAFTSSDYTAFYQRVPSEKLKTVMEFEAD